VVAGEFLNLYLLTRDWTWKPVGAIAGRFVLVSCASSYVRNRTVGNL